MSEARELWGPDFWKRLEAALEVDRAIAEKRQSKMTEGSDAMLNIAIFSGSE